MAREIAGAAAEHVQTVLASRLTIASRACDSIRARRGMYSPQDYADNARMLSENLAIIGELERLWEGFFGYVPSLLEVSQKQAVE